MLTERVVKSLGYLKNSKIKLFDTELCKDIQLTSVIEKENQSILTFGLQVQPSFCNVHLTLHGGAYSTLVDCLTTIHVWSADPEFRIAISTSLSVSFFSATKSTDYLEISTEILGYNNQSAFTKATLTVKNSPVAKGTHTLFFLDKSVNTLIQ